MKIFVCLKQVPDTETRIKLAGDQSSIDTTGIKWVVNPYDEFAIEEALKLKQANPSAVVTVVSVGPKARVSEALRTALAMGADEAIAIDAPAHIDSNATAKALALAIQAEGGAGILFTGKLAIDDNAASVSQMVAEALGVPHVTVVSKIQYDGQYIVAEREVEGGRKEIVQLQLPAVIAANKGLNMPRYASLPGIMKAKKKVIKELDWATLGVGAEQIKVSYRQFTLPPEKPPCKMISDGAPAVTLAKLLREEAKVI